MSAISYFSDRLQDKKSQITGFSRGTSQYIWMSFAPLLLHRELFLTLMSEVVGIFAE